MRAVDPANPLPLWAQIRDDLLARMSSEEFEQHFPGEDDLARHYGVSRQTVREALRHLEADGLVVRQRGRGTSLAPMVFEQSVHALYSLASTVSERGFSESSQVIAINEQPSAPPDARKWLGDLKSYLYVERVRVAGKEPIAWDRSWLPWEKTSAMVGADLTAGSLYDALHSSCGWRVTAGKERICPVIPDGIVREKLIMDDQTGAFMVVRASESHQTPIEWRLTYIHGGRYAFVATWPATPLAELHVLKEP